MGSPSSRRNGATMATAGCPSANRAPSITRVRPGINLRAVSAAAGVARLPSQRTKERPRKGGLQLRDGGYYTGSGRTPMSVASL